MADRMEGLGPATGTDIPFAVIMREFRSARNRLLFRFRGCRLPVIRDIHAYPYGHCFGFVAVGRDPERTTTSILRFAAPTT